jgi:hypothetical protein
VGHPVYIGISTQRSHVKVLNQKLNKQKIRNTFGFVITAQTKWRLEDNISYFRDTEPGCCKLAYSWSKYVKNN